MDASALYEKLGLFYLGKEVDPQTQEATEELLLVKNKDFTTHAAIIGMTGSGKTGLGIGIIEEATLDRIPSLIIDPKGDMGNLLLAFDDFDPAKFAPWVDKAEAERKGMDIPTYAQKVAETWEKGIESFGQTRERVKRFKESADFTIYTPGSSAGIPLSVLASFDAPPKEIRDDPDTFSYLLGSTVSSVLALVGIKADPLKSREYMLLTRIFNYFWKKDESLSLESLIGYVTNPPFEKVGILPLKSFYPQNDRLKLAMLLNNVLASPTFSAWTEGEPLDIQRLLYTEDAKPRVSILSIAHLSDNERMFFVTLLLNRFINWMRTQSGTSSLRALLYMDEIYGFFPATSNPPSKNPMLLLLKQARAFGIGIVLSTQNPVDLDYKGLSNIGSWFIGRLQTKQDIARVIDGLLKSGAKAMEKKEIEQILANLAKRVFLFKSAHRDRIELFTTRWVMSYLRGPLTKTQIATLMEAKKEALFAHKEASTPQPAMHAPSRPEAITQGPPPLSEEIDQYYYNKDPMESAPQMEPWLLANATVHYYNAKRAIDEEENIYLKYYLDEREKEIDWEAGEPNEDDFDLYDVTPPEGARFAPLPSFITEAKNLKSFAKAFTDYLYHEKRLELWRIPSLKLESDPGESREDLLIRAKGVLNDRKEEAIEKLKAKYAKKRDMLERRYKRALERLEKEQADVSAKTTDTVLSLGMTILDAFLGRKMIKRSTTSRAGTTLRNAGRISREKNDVKRAEERVVELEREMEDLEVALADEIDALDIAYDPSKLEIEPFYIKPRRSDITDVEMGILWESR